MMKKKHTSLLQVLFLLTLLIEMGCQTRSVTAPTIIIPAEEVTPIPTIPPLYKDGLYNHLTWFYKPPSDLVMERVAQDYGFFVLTHKDEEQREKLRALGAQQAPFLQYLILMEIQDPGSCDIRPFGNQVAYKEGDFCAISEQHPDWFLLDQNGERIPVGDGNYYMDPGNAEYQAFWLERASEMQTLFSWDGVFIDNMEASMNKFTNEDILPMGYPTEVSFQTAVVNFVAQVHARYFVPTGSPLFANITSINDYGIWQQYATYLDGIMIEAFAVDWSDGYVITPEWEAQVSVTQWALNQGKTVLLVSQGYQEDAERQEFAYASYLLVNNSNAFFRYSNSDNYNDLWSYANYSLDLGLPLGPLYRDGLTYKRDFERGTVSVNPTASSAEIKLAP